MRHFIARRLCFCLIEEVNRDFLHKIGCVVTVLGNILTFGGLCADTELNIPGFELVWHDEFEGNSVDRQKWDVNEGVNAWYQRSSDGRFVEPHWFNESFSPWITAGTINDERQYYSANNVTVRDGILEIRAEQETVNDPIGLYNPAYHQYTSGKLNTADEFQFQFGIVKWRAQLPTGQGMWPALWMLNAPDPWYWDDEIDVMEGRGSQPNISTSAHHFKVGPNNDNAYNSGTLDTGINLQQSFNEFGLEWRTDQIHTWVNDETVFVDTVAIPQNPMFLIMNAAVGGHFDGVPASNDIFPSYFLIDWARVWQPSEYPKDLKSGGFEESQGNQWANWNTRDKGNLSTVSSGALQGNSSVRLGPGFPTNPPPEPANLLTNGTAGAWSAWLNQLDNSGNTLDADAIAPSTIPATASGDALSMGIQQSATAPIVNAVVYRQLAAADVTGKTLVFSGTVSIDTTFPETASAIAFVRIFDASIAHYDVATSIINGGTFSFEAPIPASNVAFVQVGIETTGPTGAEGLLQATELTLQEATSTSPAEAFGYSGFSQTTTVDPGDTLHYGLLVAHDAADPLPSAVTGQLRFEFFDTNFGLLSEITTPIADSTSEFAPVAVMRTTTAPADSTFARLSIERVSTSPESDTIGGFVVDAVYLQSIDNSALPVVSGAPLGRIAVREGESTSLNVNTVSQTSTSFQWYHAGQPYVATEDLLLTAMPEGEGDYFLVATNAAGPVIGAMAELIVLSNGADTDGDGIPDEDESNRFLTNPQLEDTDGDGISDFGELFESQTDPLDASSALRITAFETFDNSVDLSFKSVPGIQYILHFSSDLVNWQTLGAPVQANGNVTRITSALAPANDFPRFFRISVLP